MLHTVTVLLEYLTDCPIEYLDLVYRIFLGGNGMGRGGGEQSPPLGIAGVVKQGWCTGSKCTLIPLLTLQYTLEAHSALF